MRKLNYTYIITGVKEIYIIYMSTREHYIYIYIIFLNIFLYKSIMIYADILKINYA